MPAGQHEPVAAGPQRIGGVVLHHPALQGMAEGSERHARSLVAAVRSKRSVHRHAPYEGDGVGVLFSSQRHAGDNSRPSLKSFRIDLIPRGCRPELVRERQPIVTKSKKSSRDQTFRRRGASRERQSRSTTKPRNAVIDQSDPTGGRRVKGTRCQASLLTRQCAKICL